VPSIARKSEVRHRNYLPGKLTSHRDRANRCRSPASEKNDPPRKSASPARHFQNAP
jgi:hypothetical protein